MKILSINLSIIKNGLNKQFSSVLIHKSNLTLSFLNVLFKEGVIRSYSILSDNKIEVFLKYYKGVPVLENITSVSTSSRSVYYSIEDICYWKNKYSPFNSFLVLNTSKSTFSSNELNKYKVGGQVLCIIN
jgi:small subunit ribosomal protein S8